MHDAPLSIRLPSVNKFLVVVAIILHISTHRKKIPELMSRISGCMNEVYHQIVRGKMCDCGIKDVIRYILASDYNIQDNIVEQMCTETIPQYSKCQFVITQ